VKLRLVWPCGANMGDNRITFAQARYSFRPSAGYHRCQRHHRGDQDAEPPEGENRIRNRSAPVKTMTYREVTNGMERMTCSEHYSRDMLPAARSTRSYGGAWTSTAATGHTTYVGKNVFYVLREERTMVR
jgi:hypothetical protein